MKNLKFSIDIKNDAAQEVDDICTQIKAIEMQEDINLVPFPRSPGILPVR